MNKKLLSTIQDTLLNRLVVVVLVPLYDVASCRKSNFLRVFTYLSAHDVFPLEEFLQFFCFLASIF